MSWVQCTDRGPSVRGLRRPSAVTGKPPELNHLKDADRADPGQDGQTGEPDPLPTLPIRKDGGAARAEYGWQARAQENQGQHFRLP